MASESAELTDEEMSIFNQEWDSFTAIYYAQRDFSDIFEDNKDQILEAAKVAKFQLDVPFGGMNCATNEFGWSPIQPNFLLATAAPTYATSTWAVSYATSDVTTMWKDWIGTSTSSRQLSKFATMIVLGFFDPVDVPKVSAVKPTVKGKEYPIYYVDIAMRSPSGTPLLHIWELPKPHVVEREQNLYYQVKVARAGDDEFQPFGVYFGRGDHLRDKTAYAKV